MTIRLLLAALLAAFAQPAAAEPLRVVAFAGASNLPFWAGQEEGLFAAHSIAATLDLTPTSEAMARNLQSGRYDLALTAVDNIVAYDEGEGEAPLGSVDFVALFGDDGMLSLVAAPSVPSVAALDGKPVPVDAATTGFAFALREIMARAGVADISLVKIGGGALRLAALLDAKGNATLLNTPLDIVAESHGFHPLVRVTDALGAYQGIVAPSGATGLAWTGSGWSPSRKPSTTASPGSATRRITPKWWRCSSPTCRTSRPIRLNGLIPPCSTRSMGSIGICRSTPPGFEPCWRCGRNMVFPTRSWTTRRGIWTKPFSRLLCTDANPVLTSMTTSIAGLSLRDLQYAVAVAETRHFGRAAARCAVSQPALSEQIRKLEALLGCALFERGHKGVQITANGNRLLQQANRVLAEAHGLLEMARDTVDSATSLLHLAAIQTLGPYYLPLLLRQLRSAMPGLMLRLAEGQTDALVDSLRSGATDAILAALPLPAEGLRTSALFWEPFVLVCPVGHRLATLPRLHLPDLAADDLILLEEGHCLRDQALSLCAGAAPEVRHATSIETLWLMIAAGEGYSLLPALSLNGRQAMDGLVTCRPLPDPEAGRTIALAWRATDPRGPHMGELAAQLRTRLPAGVSAVAEPTAATA